MNIKIEKVESLYIKFPLSKQQIHEAIPSVRDCATLLVKVYCSDGTIGFGRTYGGDSFGTYTVKRCIDTMIAPVVIGENPFYVHKIWKKLEDVSHFLGRAGAVFKGVSAVDIAIWDALGKITGLPLYHLLGAARDHVNVYASEGWLNLSTEELVESVKALVDKGYKAVKFRLPLDKNECIEKMSAVREAVGPDINLMVDIQNAWVDVPTSIKRVKELEKYDPFFFEEPVRVQDLDGHAEIKYATGIPITGGEHIYSKHHFREALTKNAFSYVQVDSVRVGGVSEWMKVVGMCEAWFVPVIPHAAFEIHVHTACAFPESTVPYIEYLTDYEGELLPNIYKDFEHPESGVATPPSRPGLGLTLNDDFIKDYIISD
ncbi:MAG: mandelate racemase/muconate lactonizing enzyme family protein [Clostridiaceae bacterium]|jgi:L-alanine-DL-glutamate epimerase-like enolase superfamily enzyme|nr:mandelate racemase/muconate lactonizing enzyme family protein [Clostridiaceae bacterium]